MSYERHGGLFRILVSFFVKTPLFIDRKLFLGRGLPHSYEEKCLRIVFFLKGFRNDPITLTDGVCSAVTH